MSNRDRSEMFAPTAPITIIQGKGDFIAGGATSLVERLASGDIVKRPLGREGCKEELQTEASIYKLLGQHPRLVDIRSWDAEQYILVMEYMPNGTLKEYVGKNADKITQEQRTRWALQATESVRLLHASGVLHCDIGPHNFLLDASLNLKIADFSGSSINGSRATVCPGIRYRAPDPTWKPGKLPVLSEDLFSLGSVLFFIFTGYAPFHELDDSVVEEKFNVGNFPDLSGVPFASTIKLCWQQQVDSAHQVYEKLFLLSSDTEGRWSEVERV